MSSGNIFLIIPAAGSGSRLGGDCPKQFLVINGKSILQHTLERLASSVDFRHIVIVADDGDIRMQALLAALPGELQGSVTVTPGGASRAESVFRGLEALVGRVTEDDRILVHDAARPCVRADDIRRLLEDTRDEVAGGILALPMRDTVKQAAGQYIAATCDRDRLWLAATPQVFRHAPLKVALRQALEQGRSITDEASAIEALGLPVKLVQGSPDNIKLTYPEDCEVVAAILERQAALQL